MDRLTIPADGQDLHVVRAGHGRPIVLLHGWPEFWLTWAPVMERLASRFCLIAPDLRGFGDSCAPEVAPTDAVGADTHAADLETILDALGIAQAGIVGHDVGGAVMTAFARRAPKRCAALFGFNFVHAAIGPRMGAPDRLREIWYQSFHQQDFAPALVGASRETVAAYIGHFLNHWSATPGAFDDVMEAWVDNFAQPGRLVGGFNWYRAANAGRIAMMSGTAPRLPPIAVPTCIRWTALDPIFPPSFADGLDHTFSSLDYAPFPGCGHFPHREDPDRAAEAIGAWFDKAMPS